jgi:hypothetical protein
MNDYIPGRKLTNNKQELELLNHARRLAGLPPLPEEDETAKELAQLHNVYQLFGMKGPVK